MYLIVDAPQHLIADDPRTRPRFARLLNGATSSRAEFVVNVVCHGAVFSAICHARACWYICALLTIASEGPLLAM